MKNVKLTGEERQVLQWVSQGEYLTARCLEPLYHLERKGLVETVKSGFISQVHLRITEAGRTALKEQSQ